jgi:hypothetical protein
VGLIELKETAAWGFVLEFNGEALVSMPIVRT